MSTNDYVTNDYSIEVNFLGADLDPDLVSRILGLTPVKAARRGAVRPHGNGSYEEGHWVYEASTQDDVTECRDHQLNCLIESVEPHIESLRAAGVDRILFYYTLSSFIGLLNIRFKSETMARLGALNADLYVTCFDCFNPKHPFWKLDGDNAAA
jgi:hypothetical protein